MTRPGEQAAATDPARQNAIDAAYQSTMRHDPRVWYDALPQAIDAARPHLVAAALRDAAAEMEHRDWLAAAAVLHRLANQQETP